MLYPSLLGLNLNVNDLFVIDAMIGENQQLVTNEPIEFEK